MLAALAHQGQVHLQILLDQTHTPEFPLPNAESAIRFKGD